MLTVIALQIWTVWVDTALWLCVGLLFAALAHVYLRTEHLKRWLAKPGLSSIIKAAVMGAPLPLCSCGVLPAAIGLRRAGASKEASAAFLIATPETGVDSIAVSYALLGPVYAVLRPVAALLTAVTAGLAVWKWGPSDSPAKAEPVTCCSSHPSVGVEDQPLGFREGLQYAFGNLLDDLSGWLVFGVVLAGVMLALLPPSLLGELGQSNWALVLMLLVGVPIYVCAVASTPIAAALLVAGVSPGAVLVFLLAGPATNLGGLGLIAKEFGQRFAGLYLLSIAVVALLLGYVTNQYLPNDWFPVGTTDGHSHQSDSLISLLAAYGLAVWLAGRWISARMKAE